ncbi:hypothetical protein ACQSED_26060 [Salmonella enterica]|uniref:hypothetical protein n=1 Tax=Salmonella enterica TaxID=28901 RepID=UPI003D321576
MQVKTVSPFRASGTGIVSPLPYAVVDSTTLYNLKEAPVIRTVVRLPEQTFANTGLQNIATEARFFTRYVLLLRQPAGLNLHHAGILPANLYLLTTSAFYFTGCGLHCRQALLPRDRKTAPDDKPSDTAPVQCVTLTAQSGKVTHAALSTCTRKLNCASLSLDSDTAFSGHLTHKENMNRYRRGIRTIRGITR